MFDGNGVVNNVAGGQTAVISVTGAKFYLIIFICNYVAENVVIKRRGICVTVKRRYINRNVVVSERRSERYLIVACFV